ncbi:glutamate--tRNA ligase [candidate division WWE3 bacterium]|nr:glutamate--tRNA ligase [candidate division WWE3 bacterium]
MNSPVRVRIAPSPTGYVHVGNTYIAYYNYIFAKQHNGTFIVRIDDTDQARHVADAERVIYRLFEWLGLVWQEGATIDGSPYPPYRQSEKIDRYKEKANELVDKGLAYHLDGAIYFKIQPGDPIVVHDLIRGEVVFERKNLKDFVILKSNGFPTYQFATCVDEIDHKITHVIRGEDHLSNTAFHVLAITALGGTPPMYAHMPLLRNTDESKLSKRQGHVSLQWYKDEGILPDALKNFFSLMGWSHPEQKEVFSEDEFITHFTFEKFRSRAPIFDLDKLRWLNGVKIREMDNEQLFNTLSSYYQEYDQNAYQQISANPQYSIRVVGLAKERLQTLKDFWPQNKYFYNEYQVPTKESVAKFISDDAVLLQYRDAVIALLSDASLAWEKDELDAKLHQLQSSYGLTPKQAFMTLRLIVTGESATPPLFDTLEVLGKDTVLGRIQAYLP